MAYEHVLAKYQRAQKHIEDFQSAVNLFRNSNRDSVGAKIDEVTGNAVYYIKSLPVVPHTISLILGDALHNLRSTLDHLAHAVVRPTTEKAIKHTQFPIGNSAQNYRGLANQCIEGATQPCRDIFDRIQPYQGGDFGHRLWLLHKLDIIDKHRLLLTTSFAPSSRTLTPSEREIAEARFNRFGNLRHLSISYQFISASPAPTFPLYEGQILLTVPAAEAQHDMGFAFDVAIHEPGIIEPTPALLLLRLIAGEVQCAITDLAPCAALP